MISDTLALGLPGENINIYAIPLIVKPLTQEKHVECMLLLNMLFSLPIACKSRSISACRLEEICLLLQATLPRTTKFMLHTVLLDECHFWLKLPVTTVQL